MINNFKIRLNGAAERFIEKKLSLGIVSFSLVELVKTTGLSVVAARHQLLRMGDSVVRVSPRHQFFLIVTPEHKNVGAPPVEWWIDDYFKWLNRPYYLALQSAATLYGSSPQAIQETQIMTNTPIREIQIGRIRVRFFTKSNIKQSITTQLPNAFAPLNIGTPESTAFDLIRYASGIGGIERAAETIKPMVILMKVRELKRVLDAENEISTAQRLGFVLETIKSNVLANVVHDWLPKRMNPVLVTTHFKTDVNAPFIKTWAIKNNSRSFA